MASTIVRERLSDQQQDDGVRWWPVGVGLLSLYVPTYWMLAGTLWRREEFLYGPIVLAVVLWQIWSRREQLARGTGAASPAVGSVFLIFGLLLYVVGRSQDIVIFEVGSQIPVLAAVLLLLRGWPGIRAMWFPLLYLVFMLPLPGFLVDAITGPLKEGVSVTAESLLYHVGYPIARSGVVLSVGPYRLLVADACAGLHSLISISAMGLLYIYLMHHRNPLQNVVLVLSLVPIALLSNVVRVIVLVLVTYHLGDEAGQGFIHGFSGILLFVVGLLSLFGLDAVAGRLFAARRGAAT